MTRELWGAGGGDRDDVTVKDEGAQLSGDQEHSEYLPSADLHPVITCPWHRLTYACTICGYHYCPLQSTVLKVLSPILVWVYGSAPFPVYCHVNKPPPPNGTDRDRVTWLSETGSQKKAFFP